VQFGVSTQLYHGRRLAQDHLREIAAHGFDRVELVATRTHFDYHDPAAAASLGSWLAGSGLGLHSVHAPFAESFADGRWGPAFSNASGDEKVRARAVAETIAALEIARHVPFQFLVLHLGLPDSLPPPPGDNLRDAACRSIEQIEEHAERLGVRVALEVIPNGLSAPDSVADLIENRLDLPRLGACLDVGHALIMGDPVDAVESLSGTLITTHVHDNHGRNDEHLVPFEGNVDWPAVLISLEKIGYEGVLMLELANTSTPAAVLQKARGACSRLEHAVETWT
jgi:sugar phosphate isomerase/epimerase